MIPAMTPCLPDIARKRIFDYVRGDSMILLKKLIIIIYHYVTLVRGVYFLLQKVFERGFIHVKAYAENLYFTTYSSNEFSVQIR